MLSRHPLTRTLFITLLALLSASCGESRPVLEITDAYVRSPVPGQSVGAGFLSLRNHSDAAIVLTAVSSPVAKSAEIHEHRHDNGTMRMRQLEKLSIAAGESAHFKPGGLHVMLFGMEGEQPQKTRLVFSTADGQEFATDAEIRRP